MGADVKHATKKPEAGALQTGRLRNCAFRPVPVVRFVATQVRSLLRKSWSEPTIQTRHPIHDQKGKGDQDVKKHDENREAHAEDRAEEGASVRPVIESKARRTKGRYTPQDHLRQRFSCAVELPVDRESGSHKSCGREDDHQQAG